MPYLQVPAYGPQNDVTLKMPAFEWVHVQLHQQRDDKFITTDYLQQCPFDAGSVLTSGIRFPSSARRIAVAQESEVFRPAFPGKKETSEYCSR